MERIAAFEFVKEENFVKALVKEFSGRNGIDEAAASGIYKELKKPHRATSGSAGYDIYTPVDVELRPGESVKIPTGIRVRMREDYCLVVAPRSGLGTKFRFQLNNTVGVIDSDYYYSDNEGHIFVSVINDGREGKDVVLKTGTAFVQAIFLSYGITEDDDCEAVRNGGFGSTGS